MKKLVIVAAFERELSLLEKEDFAAVGINPLSNVGNRISAAVRRAILLDTLERLGWNLTRTSEYFSLGSSGNVIRLIRDLGLDEEYEAAKLEGKVTKARNKKNP